jgi:DNA-binding MarR family transcriptional regulator
MNERKTPSHPHYQALLQLLRTADTLWNASRIFFARWDLSPSQFNVLNLLSSQPDGYSQIELGRLLLTHRSNVTGLVDRLERRGLIRRRDAASDRRAYRVGLTADGRRLLGQVLPEYYLAADGVWAGFPAVRAKSLAADLERLGANAEKWMQTKEEP